MSARPTTIRRRALRGNAILEFVLTLPIVFFLTGLIMYMSFGMLARQKALVDARRALWRSAGHGQWTNMRLEGYTPGTLVEDDGTKRPRGFGEELDRLRPDVEPDTIAQSSNPKARDYWFRTWDNLPGRHEAEASRSFKTEGRMWKFIDRTATSKHQRDTSPWHFYHLDAWKIARSGPLREIYQAFKEHLEMAQFAPHFEQTRDDIIRRWFHGDEVLEEDTY